MKILLVAEKYPPIVGGGETHLHQLAEGLVARGHEVTVATEAVPDGPERRLYREGAVRIRELTGLMDACRRLDAKAAVASLHSLFTTSDADVIHVFNYVPALLTSWLRPAIGAQLAVSLFETHMPGQRVFDLWGDYPLERSLQRGLVDNLRPDVMVCGSQAYRRWALDAGFADQDIHVVEFGTDLGRFRDDGAARARWRTRHGVADDETVFLIPARPVPRKCIEDAVTALARLVARHPRTRLVLTTPTARTLDSYAHKLRALADELGVADRVIWEQGLSWHDMPTLFCGADAVVLPSSHEGFGIALVEGMASRRPVITSNVEGHDEVIDHGRTGFLYPARDAEALAQCMERVVTSDLEDLVTAAHAEAERRFSSAAVAAGHERAYEAACAQR
ncbi:MULTISPECIES: glycosyltransferase family 4 protein [unclassified Streptomyces]|uniref:glycosyltransferase family 4 protein n=1 Tax=unclassified Streptomyces TaxID=2593676 RepID=UPI0003758E35|nr:MULTISPECIES: glycosyltransferase family 4 protein [unclassified Streptomyces]MYT29972.1 glycosyltransferase [Streptomyces sp. SID8354]